MEYRVPIPDIKIDLLYGRSFLIQAILSTTGIKKSYPERPSKKRKKARSFLRREGFSLFKDNPTRENQKDYSQFINNSKNTKDHLATRIARRTSET